mgnify:FL=1|tara:strand:+ start:1611 stop:2546 length:936 start_codon:yes stop_codon:yes gene_type:complete
MPSTAPPKKTTKTSKKSTLKADEPVDEVDDAMDAALAMSDDEEQEEEEAHESEEEEEEEGSEAEETDDEEEGEGEGEGEAEERKAERERNAATRRRVAAKRRGHRKIATLGGFPQGYVSHHAERDVNAPVLSAGEVRKAAKWAPALADKAAFEGLAEFEERTTLSQTPLAPGPLEVLRANGEVFLRRLFVGAVTRQADASRTSPSVAMVVAETRPLKRALKYSFVGTDLKGLVRFAQNDQPGRKLSMFDGEHTAMQREKDVHKEQVGIRKAVLDAAIKRKHDTKEEKVNAKGAGAEPARKKKKKEAQTVSA